MSTNPFYQPRVHCAFKYCDQFCEAGGHGPSWADVYQFMRDTGWTFAYGDGWYCRLHEPGLPLKTWGVLRRVLHRLLRWVGR